LQGRDDGLKGKICTVSGSGNVAQYTVEKLNQLGAKPVTLSDSDGFIYDPDGINEEKLAWVMALKEVRRGRINEYTEKFRAEFFPGKRPWGVRCDCAFPSATQNELSGEDAGTLLQNGCRVISEGANMPSEPDAVRRFIEGRICYGPGKAANAGGVAISGLEMSQNSLHYSWTREEVEQRLQEIMHSIYTAVSSSAAEYDQPANLVMGANIAGFVKVADAMIDQGVV
jgi:glutamate dehydrogenase (NADP+)